MTATYQIKSAALSPQFINELREKYGETELEIRVQTGGTRSQILSDAQFWQIIELLDWQESGDDEAVVAPLVAHLASLPVSFIYQFQDKLSEKLFNLDTKSHAAAFNTPFSVDDFLYSRCAVVANGKKVYDSVLNDASLMPTNIDFEALLYVASDAYMLKTGKNFEYVADFPIETCSNKKGWA